MTRARLQPALGGSSPCLVTAAAEDNMTRARLQPALGGSSPCLVMAAAVGNMTRSRLADNSSCINLSVVQRGIRLQPAAACLKSDFRLSARQIRWSAAGGSRNYTEMAVF